MVVVARCVTTKTLVLWFFVAGVGLWRFSFFCVECRRHTRPNSFNSPEVNEECALSSLSFALLRKTQSNGDCRRPVKKTPR